MAKPKSGPSRRECTGPRDHHGPPDPIDMAPYTEMKANPEYIEIAPNHFMKRSAIIENARNLPWKYIEAVRSDVRHPSNW